LNLDEANQISEIEQRLTKARGMKQLPAKPRLDSRVGGYNELEKTSAALEPEGRKASG